jgi:hypothetical protein
MPKTPHEQIVAAGFSPADTQMLIGVFDSVSTAHPQNRTAASIIVDSLCMMADLQGARAPEKLAAYAEQQVRLVRSIELKRL